MCRAYFSFQFFSDVSINFLSIHNTDLLDNYKYNKNGAITNTDLLDTCL